MGNTGKTWLFATGLLVSLLGSPGGAAADKVFLVSGSVLEGKAVLIGDKVTVELAAGTISLDARSVLRIEPGRSPLELLAKRRAALPKEGIRERLALADAYRNEGALREERELLQEILVLDSDHAQARQRLGFVRTRRGWVHGVEQLRANGFVKRGDSWLSPDQISARATAELQRQTAELTRQKAALELQARRDELASAQRKGQQPAPEPLVVYPWVVSPRPGFPAAGPGSWQLPGARPPGPVPAPFLNGVRDPYSYFP